MAHAMGLGRLVVHSGLDERLNAEIELTGASAAEIKTLRGDLASRAEFEAAGIERLPLLSTIKFSPVTRADGRSYLVLATEQPVREPFLHFLLEVKWAGGRILREYTALLDPPHWVQGAPAPVESPVVGRVTEAAPEVIQPERKFGPPGVDTRAGAQAAVVADGQREGDWSSVAQYGPVARGETLSGIVKKIARDQSVSGAQAMLALLRANPQAFFRNNINNLRAGQILKIPQRAEVVGIDRAAALREARTQNSAWREYRMKLAGATSPVAAAPAEESAKAKMEVTAKAPEKGGKSEAPAEGQSEVQPGDLLKIVRAVLDDKGAAEGSGVSSASPGAPSGAEQSKLRDQVATLEEALESKRLENKELQERVAALQSMVENTKRLIEIQNREAAIAQKGAAEPKTETPAEARKPESAKPASVAPAAPVVKPAAKKPPPPAPPVASAGFLDDLLGNPVTLGMLGTVIVLGGVILILYVRRRGQAKSEFAESILSGGTVGSIGEPVTAAGGGKGADASFLSEFSKGGMGNIHHTEEVDPIAEAEVYLAYGRDEQAEEILKEAVAKDPARQELKLKLLEIYNQRNDLPAFETLAEELYAATEGKGGKIWTQVETMGRKLNPDNPMFRGGQAPEVVPAPAAPAVAGRETPPPAQFAQAGASEAHLDLDLTGNTGEISLDQGFEPPAVGAPAEATKLTQSIKDTMIDFDSPFAKPESAVPVEEEQPWPTIDASRSIAFEPSVVEPAPPASEAPSSRASTDGPAAADVTTRADWDEIATKLDLAKAYIDMGDSDGARSILNEVMDEGSDLQKKQAQELVAQIG